MEIYKRQVKVRLSAPASKEVSIPPDTEFLVPQTQCNQFYNEFLVLILPQGYIIDEKMLLQAITRE